LRDQDLTAWAHNLKERVSLTAQQKTIRSARDYEFMRARRLVLFVFGYLHRMTRAVNCQNGLDQNDLEELGRRLLIVLGCSAVPILISVLRNDAFRRKIMSSLLGFTHRLCLRPDRDSSNPGLAGRKRPQALPTPLFYGLGADSPSAEAVRAAGGSTESPPI
jgi:hypothetical protein